MTFFIKNVQVLIQSETKGLHSYIFLSKLKDVIT